MTHHPKAPSAGSIEGSGKGRGHFRRALATRDASTDTKGSGAPSSRRLPAILAVLTLAIAAFAITAAPASAAPVAAEMGSISGVSYTSAKVSGKVSGNSFVTTWTFEYSKDPDGEGWMSGATGNFGLSGPVADEPLNDVPITGLKGGTTYFVRLHAHSEADAFSPASGPYPSFTTLAVDPPSVTSIDNASDVAYTTATVKGKVNRPANSDPAFSVDCHFQYVTDKQFNETGFENPGAVPCEGPNPIKNPGSNDVEAHLTELANDTEYHLRLFVSNASPTTDAKVASTFKTLKVDPPSVNSVENASEVEYTQAQVKGVVERPNTSDDPAFDVSCNFEYVTQDQFKDEGFAASGPSGQNVGCSPNPVTAADTAPGATREVVAALGGLTPSTTYHLRITASNQGGSDAKEAAATFTTQGPAPAPSVLSIDDASDIHVNSAKVTGSVKRPAGADPGLDVNCSFEYISDAQFKENEELFSQPGFTGAAQAPCETGNPAETPGTVKAAGNVAVSATIGVSAGTTYHLRLAASNVGGSDAKEASTFTSRIPVLGMDPPIAGYTTAEVSGTVNPEGGNANLYLEGHFQYSTEPANPDSWIDSNVGFGFENPTGDTPIPVGGTIKGLQPGTTYAFRVYATNLTEFTVFSPEPNPEATTKPLAAPTATLDPVADITATGAHFSGTVNANAPGPLDALGEAAYETRWHIECEPACGRILPAGSGSGVVKAGEGAKAISVDATELEPNQHYEVKLIAENSYPPLIATATETFPTPLVTPTIKQFEGGSDGEGGYTLQGTVNPNNSKVTDCKFVWGPESHPDPAEYAFKADCSPMPVGVDEEQKILLVANPSGNNASCTPTEGQFKLTFGGQTTNDLPYNAAPGEVEAALEALSTIGPGAVAVTGTPQSYKVRFESSLAKTNVESIRGKDGTIPLGSSCSAGGLGSAVQVATTVQGGSSKPITVEAHLAGLNVGAHYHALLVATNAAGESKGVDQEFVPTEKPTQSCPNEQQRKENSSEALPECRAYEQVTAPEKSGIAASLGGFSADGNAVVYKSRAGNIANSGQANPNGNLYATVRSNSGWKTLANLNGPSGSLFTAPDGFFGGIHSNSLLVAYSANFLSSVWVGSKQGERAVASPGTPGDLYLRHPDGTFTKIGNGSPSKSSPEYPGYGNVFSNVTGASEDLSHVFVNGVGNELQSTPVWGFGVYEFVGTGNDQPRRVDVDNSGAPISTCFVSGLPVQKNAQAHRMSPDGRTLIFTVGGGCGAPNPPADEVWARVGGTTSFDVSASQCTRGDCNDPANAHFQGAATDGSRVFFTTAQQLLDADTDQTNDLYACDLPSGNPTPTDKANACAALRQVSGAQTGANVENVRAVSADGSAALFTAKGVLTSNEDALKEKAVPGDHNVYLWRTDAAHPDGQTTFLGRLNPDDLAGFGALPQLTPDGRYLVFTTANQLVPSDTDAARDIYRYDADTATMTRVSVGTSGASGNADGFDASISGGSALADDGSVVFTTIEPLSPLDGNGESDVYLWRAGHVYLISTGATGGSGSAAISGSGRDIYFNTSAQLSPSDLDFVGDVYDARVEGGFSFPKENPCSEESCQPPPPTPFPIPTSPANRSSGEGNVKPKTCPKGKVLKGKKCVKKPHKKHSGKKHHHEKNKRTASHSRGGSK